MSKLNHWKQLNPKDQSKSIFMAIEGYISLMEVRPLSINKSLRNLREHIEELKVLHDQYLKESW